MPTYNHYKQSYPRRGPFIVHALAILLALTPTLRADPSADRFAFAPPTSAAQLVADQLITRAREADGPTMRHLLTLAAQLTPDDAELHRLCAEAAKLAGDETGYRNALRRYLAQEPRDDAAQLDLLLSYIAVGQTLEQRAAAVDGILAADDADRLTAPLRSRLASYIAAAAYETGDTAAAVQRIKQAFTLDAANPQAARLTWQLTESVAAPPAAQVMALLALLRAEPFSPAPHAALGHHLMAMGLIEAATAQYAAARALGATVEPAQAVAVAPDPAITAAIKRLSAHLATPTPATAPPVSLTISLMQGRYRYLDPIIVTVTMRNMTDEPLALGPEGALPATLLLAVTPDKADPPPPMVVDLRRRLRLDAHQAVTVAVAVHRSPIGRLLAMEPTTQFDLTVSAVLNPRIGDDGSVIVPSIGALAAARPVQRRGLAATEANLALWLAAVTTDPPTHIDTLTTAARLCTPGVGDPDRIERALANFRGRTDRLGRAYLACFLPADRFPNLRAALAADPDPLIAACLR